MPDTAPMGSGFVNRQRAFIFRLAISTAFLIAAAIHAAMGGLLIAALIRVAPYEPSLA